MTATYRIGGMTCNGCAGAVTHAIQRLDPKAVVTVDLVGGKVSVDGKLAPEAVRRAVETAGFTFDGA
jgi:copper chaperone